MFPSGTDEAFLGHFKINRFFYRSENGKGQAAGFTDFLLLTKIKVLQSLEERTVHLISLNGTER